MPRPASRAARRGASAPLLALLCLILGLVAWGPQASAHDSLLSSTPASGSVHATAPDSATLTFSGQLGKIGAVVLLEGSDGKDRELAPEVSGTTLTVPLPSDATGRQRLKWRVVSEDGHPIEGVVEYTVGTSAGASPGASSGPTTPTAASEAGSSTGPSQSASASSPGLIAAPTGSDDSGKTGLIVLAGAAGGLLAGGIALVLLLRRSSTD